MLFLKNNPWVNPVLKSIAILAMFVGVGCGGTHKISNIHWDRERLFPDGIHQHRVQITMPNGKTVPFSSVIEISPDKINVVGLSFLNMQIFQIQDDRKIKDPAKAVKVEIFLDAMQKHETRLRLYYAVLKKVLLLKQADVDSRAVEVKATYPETKRIKTLVIPGGRGVEVSIGEYDALGIPSKMELNISGSDPGENVKAEIKVLDYELK
jgi:hypothetical protein